MFKNGVDIVPLKLFNGNVDEKNKIPQCVYFRCGRVHINIRWKKKGISYKLQPSLLKKEREHDEIYDDTWEAKEDEWLPYVK